MLTNEEIEKHAQSLAEAAGGHVHAERSIAQYSVLLSRANGWTADEMIQISLKALKILKGARP